MPDPERQDPNWQAIVSSDVYRYELTPFMEWLLEDVHRRMETADHEQFRQLQGAAILARALLEMPAETLNAGKHIKAQMVRAGYPPEETEADGPGRTGTAKPGWGRRWLAKVGVGGTGGRAF